MKNSLLIGSGRWATHLAFYLRSLGIDFRRWARSTDTSAALAEALSSCDRVWLAVSDRALEDFVRRELAGFRGTIVHFSGALDIPGTVCAHPMMTFGPELYEPAFYRGVHFTVTGAAALSEALPVPNEFTVLPSSEKALYHALCVLGGNLPVLLWKKSEEGLRGLGLPEEAIRDYFLRAALNYRSRGPAALTGPLARGDQDTIRKNLVALGGDAFEKVYAAFVEAVR